eukprot:Awhi_evm1s13297
MSFDPMVTPMGVQNQTTLVSPEDSGIEHSRRVVNFEQYRRENRLESIRDAIKKLLEGPEQDLDAMIKTTTLKEENDERRHQNRRNHEVLLERYEARQNPPPPPSPAASTAVAHSSPSKKHDW